MSKRGLNLRGFALVDVMIAMVIIGVSVSSLMALFASGTTAQGQAASISTGMRLAQNVHDYALTLQHNYVLGTGITDLSSLANGHTFTQVIDSTGSTITDVTFSGWSQYAKVEALNPTTLVPVTVANQADWPWRPKLLTVSISRNNKVVYTQKWLLAPNLQGG